jgi:hypothetical protein
MGYVDKCGRFQLTALMPNSFKSDWREKVVPAGKFTRCTSVEAK